MAEIVVLGAGNFGTCLAQHLATLGHNVRLWHRDPQFVEELNRTRRNPKYLTFCELSPRVTGFYDPASLGRHSSRKTSVGRSEAPLPGNSSSEKIGAGGGFDAIVFAIPTQSMRQVLELFQLDITHRPLMICANKGIDMDTYQLPVDVISSVFGKEAAERAVVLSGPSFAAEVAQKQPTCVVAASRCNASSEGTQALFHTPFFRVYSNDDPVGIEVAGATKNVIAIAVGAASGLGLENNTRAALICRGLAEMTRLGIKMGAQVITFSGLGGVGDLFLTCTSEKSRNYTVGYRVGRGEQLSSVLTSVGSVAEGVFTAKAAYHLAHKLGVRTPIIDEVYRVLYEGKPLNRSFQDLISSEAKEEFELG